jgi:hypothetical protein
MDDKSIKLDKEALCNMLKLLISRNIFPDGCLEIESWDQERFIQDYIDILNENKLINDIDT